MLTLKQKRTINKAFRDKDDSHLWPIEGAFNATDRAIRQASKIARANGEYETAFEYSECLHYLIGQIVNDPKNQ